MMITYCKLRPIEWLRENAFEDDQGDFWLSAEEFEAWDSASGGEKYAPEDWLDFVSPFDIGSIRSFGTAKKGEKLPEETDVWFGGLWFIEWAIEKIYTRDEYPEMYL